MNILKVDDKEISYTEVLTTGIYKVTDSEMVKTNCEALNITIEEPVANQVVEKVSKIDLVGVLTIRFINQYTQFIFTSDVKATDFDYLLAMLPPSSHDAFRSAYNATKPLTLDNFEGFEKLFSNIKDSN